MTKSELASKIDHTLLKPDASAAQIRQLCAEAEKYGFHAVCVNSGRAALARSCLTDAKLCVVIGFPLGSSAVKAREAEKMFHLGADEFDMVMDIGLARDGNWAGVAREIGDVRAVCPNRLLKVILETCLLRPDEILSACHAAEDAGADFVKTSTGFSSGGARAEDVALMASCGLPVKASGGIRTYAQAKAMLDAGASRIGTSAGISILEGWEEAQP